MADTHDFVKEAATSIYAVSADEAVKLACEARERYDHDWASSFWSGEQSGIKKEKVNTEREKKRADEAEKRANEEKKRADDAETKLQMALAEIERLKGGRG